MKKQIKVDSNTCIKCGKCVKVCPAMIFIQDSKIETIELVNEEGCISCGHCVAACPSESVYHEDFPSEKVHKVDLLEMPSPEQLLLLCKYRRSNRAFSAKQIPKKSLDMILEAAHRAPTASNMQQVEFTLITDPAKLKSITEFTIGFFMSVVKKLETPILKPILKLIMPKAYDYLPNLKRLIDEHSKGNDLILRNATAVILIHTPNDSKFGTHDANLAYQNGSLMAESMGISQFYMGFVCVAIEQEKTGSLAKSFGIKGKIQAAMALGVPSFRYSSYIDRKDIIVNQF